mgnify:CR=1 FL=1
MGPVSATGRVCRCAVDVFAELDQGSRPEFSVDVELSADGLIERLVNRHQNPEKICVITSDQLEQQIVSSSGAYVESSEIFMQKCKNSKNTSYSTNMKASQKPKLGDFFPNDLK